MEPIDNDIFQLTVSADAVVDIFHNPGPAAQGLDQDIAEYASADTFTLPEPVEFVDIPEGEPCEDVSALPEGWSLKDGAFFTPGGLAILDIGGYEASMELAAYQFGGMSDLLHLIQQNTDAVLGTFG